MSHPLQRQEITSAGEDVEEKQPRCTVVVNVIGHFIKSQEGRPNVPSGYYDHLKVQEM